MKFDTPAGSNPIDRGRVIGRPTDRVTGALKTTGRATYAYEHNEQAPNAAYGYVVGAAIAKGRITAIRDRRAKRASGVLAIVTHENAGPIGTGRFFIDKLLAGPEIDHYHQAVAVVVAQSFEQARAAAHLLEIDYESAPGTFDLRAIKDDAELMPEGRPFSPPAESRVGDFDGAFAAAPVTVDAEYSTPDQAHAMIEPHATIASWSENEVVLWTGIQQIFWGVRDLALILGIAEDRIRLVSPFIGGGFGGKGTILTDAVLASLGSRAAGRPVKLAMPRPLMFNNLTHRPATIQRVRLGADREGRLTAIGHESWSGNLEGGRTEAAVLSTRVLYAGANRMTQLRLGVLDLAEGSAMRAPGETPGMMALEIAMDEMAEKLDMDPIEFRVRNDTQVDPETPDRPFSQRQLVECLRTGGERFGWAERHARPARRLEGEWWVGMGMASAVRGAPIMKSAARVTLGEAGRVVVETDMTDIGTGSYTIIAQTAAEMLGVPLAQVTARLGDSRFPQTPGSGGQWGAASSTAGVYAACVKLREQVAETLGVDAETAVFENGEVVAGDTRRALIDAVADGPLTAEDEITYGDLHDRYAQQTFGAQFVELGVHAATGEVRLRRMLAVCAAGRILNPKAARSQIIGGMVMGAGAALTEAMEVDTDRGFFVNHDLAGYEVPVHADVPEQDVVFLDELDPYNNPLKAKGVGELGITGVGAAIANAVYNACGVRVRDYPITVDKLIEHLPEVEYPADAGRV